MIPLYKLPRDENIKIFGLTDLDDKPLTVIFHHTDGMYSLCHVEGTNEIVHLSVDTELEPVEGGYKVVTTPKTPPAAMEFKREDNL